MTFEGILLDHPASMPLQPIPDSYFFFRESGYKYFKWQRNLMIQELYYRNTPIIPFRFKRYFESKNNKIRIFGQCEATGKLFEITMPAERFFVYLQGFKNIAEALSSISEEEREFILTGVSPEGQKMRIK